MGPPPPPPPAPAAIKPTPAPTNLLKSIEKGTKLRKTQTNDRSAAIIEAPKGGGAGMYSSSAARPKIPSSNNNYSSVDSSPAPQLGGLFAGGMPKLRSRGGPSSESSSAPSSPAPRVAPKPLNSNFSPSSYNNKLSTPPTLPSRSNEKLSSSFEKPSLPARPPPKPSHSPSMPRKPPSPPSLPKRGDTFTPSIPQKSSSPPGLPSRGGLAPSQSARNDSFNTQTNFKKSTSYDTRFPGQDKYEQEGKYRFCVTDLPIPRSFPSGRFVNFSSEEDGLNNSGTGAALSKSFNGGGSVRKPPPPPPPSRRPPPPPPPRR